MLRRLVLSYQASFSLPLRNLSCILVDVRAGLPLTARHKEWMITEQLVHIFEVEAFCLGLESPEKDGVGKVADDEYNVVFPADCRYSDWSHFCNDVSFQLFVIQGQFRANIRPISVLNAKDVIAPQDTPLSLMAVPKSSAGIDQLSGPLVMKKTKLNAHVMTTNAQCAPVLWEVVGKTLMMAALIMKVAQRKRHPYISSGRRPMESIVRMQTEVPAKATIALTACRRSVKPVEIPIWAKIWGEKYWIALTPVI